jgi:hypothetical protein
LEFSPDKPEQPKANRKQPAKTLSSQQPAGNLTVRTAGKQCGKEQYPE